MTVSVSTKHLMTGAAMVALVAAGGWRIHAQGGGQVQRNPCAECGTGERPEQCKTIENFFKLPDGREWGSTSLVDIDKNGRTSGPSTAAGQTAACPTRPPAH